MMSRIGQKNTWPERTLRAELFADGFRYRLHDKRLPGSPDVVFPKYRAVIFVHGCFWHRHPSCRFATTPKTNAEFWTTKFSQNVERDARQLRALGDLGWRVAVVWECAIKEALEETTKDVENWLRSTTSHIVIGMVTA